MVFDLPFDGAVGSSYDTYFHKGSFAMNTAQSEFSAVSSPELPFVDRRQTSQSSSGTGERRQFGNSYHNLSSAGKDLAEAIDAYKLQYRRRYITTDELLGVLTELGYRRD